MRRDMGRTRFLLAEQAQFSIASEPIFWQKLSTRGSFSSKRIRRNYSAIKYEESPPTLR